ncbi:MAG: 3'-5' exonuclease [Rhodovarius sp.]|nr:3'-5' exonuclease [Rhodovarius sp.]
MPREAPHAPPCPPPSLLRRAMTAIGRGLGPNGRDLLRARAHFHAPLPPGPLASQRYVVFDLEATGLQVSRDDRLVAIGAVLLRDMEPVAVFETLVHPGRPIPPAATAVHGITDAMVQSAPPAPEAIAAFLDFAGDAVLVAHNAGFDRSLLFMEEYRGAPAVAQPILCSLALSRWLDPQEEDHSLDALCGRAGLVIPRRHAALGDAEATAALWVRMLARAAARGVEDLTELCRRSRMQQVIAAAAEHF